MVSPKDPKKVGVGPREGEEGRGGQPRPQGPLKAEPVSLCSKGSGKLFEGFKEGWDASGLKVTLTAEDGGGSTRVRGQAGALLWSRGGGHGGGLETILEVELLELADRLHPRGWNAGGFKVMVWAFGAALGRWVVPAMVSGNPGRRRDHGTVADAPGEALRSLGAGVLAGGRWGLG